jgi:chromosome segregation ATPase
MDAEAERAERAKVQACAAAELGCVGGELAAAQEALRGLEQAEARLEGELQAALKRADEAEGRMSEVAGHLSALQADVSRGMGAVGEKMALLDGECAALERGLMAVEAEYEQVGIWDVLCGHGCSGLTRGL